MTFHREGIPSIIVTIVFIVALNFTTHFFLNEYEVVIWLGYILSAFLFVVVVQFFRSPTRNVIVNNNQIISPCDGKVVVVEEVLETEHLQEKRIQVSIFMSPINVHSNRYPISGEIEYYKYHAGKYLVAWHPKSSTDNERTTVVVKDDLNRKVLFRQIAGALARRIVFYGQEKDMVEQGQECGFIKFGSRVDLLLPLNATIKVNLQQKVVGGKTIIAEW